MVVDVDELAREALREESRDEQRHVAEPLQSAMAIRGGWRLERFGEHHHERLEAGAAGRIRRLVVQRFGAREQREEIDDVVLGLIFDGTCCRSSAPWSASWKYSRRFVTGTTVAEILSVGHVHAGPPQFLDRPPRPKVQPGRAGFL